jgi:alkylated DNA repair dioxygenase AlkB
MEDQNDPVQVTHYKECFTLQERKTYFSRLSDEIPWTRQQWKAGKFLPRQTHRYDIPSSKSQKIAVLEDLIVEVEEMLECRVNGIWCNLYRNGADYTPPHQDKYGSHVVTLSFGSTRRCVIHSLLGAKIGEYILEDGDIFYFSPEYDNEHKHSIPKTSVNIEPRISIVFFTTRPWSREEPPLSARESNVYSTVDDVQQRELVEYEDSDVDRVAQILLATILYSQYNQNL